VHAHKAVVGGVASAVAAEEAADVVVEGEEVAVVVAVVEGDDGLGGVSRVSGGMATVYSRLWSSVETHQILSGLG